MRNPYDVLGVPVTATAAEIKSAFRELAKQHHADKGGDDEVMREVNAAYEILSDPEKRARFDATGEAASEAQNNLVQMMAALVNSYKPGANIVTQLHQEVTKNMRDFTAARIENAAKSQLLESLKSRIIFKGDGHNLLADVVQSQIDRIAAADVHLVHALKTGEEMLALLDPYSFRKDQASWDFSVPKIGSPSREDARLNGILRELVDTDRP